jgi:hypothetical protein
LAFSSLVLKVAQQLHHKPLLALTYPTSSRNEPRWGQSLPNHEQLEAILKNGNGRYAGVLSSFSAFVPDLEALPSEPNGNQPGWENIWLTGLDAISLYCFLRQRNPARYVEVGSGNSTLFAARARRDGGLRTKITSIDPHPRAAIDHVCDEPIRLPLEDADLSLFANLEAGDVVFIDNSHQVFMNSDTTVFFLDVLPSLPTGVLVGIHDIFLPSDYPTEWCSWYLAEQYLLAAFLLADCPWLDVILPNHWVSIQNDLSAGQLAPLLEQYEGHQTFWLEVVRH